jgi:hypothetical protein
MHKMTQGFFLRNLGYERNSFCELTTVKTDDGNLATGRRLGRSSTDVGTVSGDALAPRTPLAMAARVWPNLHGIGLYL